MSKTIRDLKKRMKAPRNLVEAVKKGDLLITGLWDTYNNWGEKTGKSFSAAARGKVIAEVRKVYSYKTELKYTEFINGKLSERKSLYLFGQSFPLSFPLIENDKYKAMQEAGAAVEAILSQVNGVLTFYVTGEEPQSWTHDCSTCGGCQ